MKEFVKHFTELIAVLAIVINSIQFLLFSLVGIEYDPEQGTGLVAIVNVACCLYTVAWVILKEMNGHPIHNVKWTYYLPIWIILSFFLEMTIFDGDKFGTFAGKQFLFFGTAGVPAIYLATYLYRYERFDIITRSSDIIMLICTLALTLNIPHMFNDLGRAIIAGAGGHQEISYSAALCFGINWTNIITENTQNRYAFTGTKFYKYLSFALLILQAMVCIMGGGRGGALLMVVTFVISIFLFARQHFMKTMFWAVIALAVFAVVAQKSGQFTEGFGRAFNYISDGGISTQNDMSDIEREGLRQVSYRIIDDSPIIGHGLWHGLVVAGYYMHNVFLDVMISGGYIYLLIFLFIMFKCYKSVNRVLKYDTARCLLLPYMLFPTVMLLFSGYYLTSSFFWFFVIYALLCRKDTYIQNN